MSKKNAKTPPSWGRPNYGLECRECGCKEFFTLETRPIWNGRIRRRRECRHCGKRVTTLEVRVS
ncbi:transcriptional regulator NrdR [Phycisphaerae bacterium RAS1]|nr:transcriptional regulator NrdR [Phycisphaerae bacterium RAS1]TWT45041.1 transcriptional regulator NrdR [Phycisphaerae bacterium RAS1]